MMKGYYLLPVADCLICLMLAVALCALLVFAAYAIGKAAGYREGYAHRQPPLQQSERTGFLSENEYPFYNKPSNKLITS